MDTFMVTSRADESEHTILLSEAFMGDADKGYRMKPLAKYTQRYHQRYYARVHCLSMPVDTLMVASRADDSENTILLSGAFMGRCRQRL